MSSLLTENMLWRNIYCNVSKSSSDCMDMGYSFGIIPSGFEWLAFILSAISLIGLVINGVLGGVIVLIWGERRLFGRFQNRTGPNRWGPYGILTPVADAIKTMFKEDILPKDADRLLYNLAPIMVVVPVLIVFSVIPFGLGSFVVDLNVGILFVLAITSISSLSVLTAGWSSGNRIAILSALRSVALLISYEIPMGLAVIGVIMLSGSLSLGSIVESQQIPYILVQPLGFFVFFLAAMAEMARAPFDLTEAESELAAGHLNDYSSMKFALFFLGEFMAELATAAIVTTLFLGGWKGPDFIPSEFWFGVKLVFVLFLIVWFRMTLPRLRVDQVLQFAWKGLFELTMINIITTAIFMYIWPEPGVKELLILAAINWPVAIISIWGVSKILGTKQYENLESLKNENAYPYSFKTLPSEFYHEKVEEEKIK
ncbi:MAG: NADH-quinone oxidoreductase subunit NuoH [SAR202 cluster bacterium]|nr:NADH-quinone oxidoreductase subunit NuoH [SAR202 cluster bacterium]